MPPASAQPDREQLESASRRTDEAATDADTDLEDALDHIASLPPLEQCTPPGREFALPPKASSAPALTLVLDLDETLVHSSLDASPLSGGGAAPAFSFSVSFEEAEQTVHVRLRPGLAAFLRFVASSFEVVLFTASHPSYAVPLLDRLERDVGRVFAHRLFFDSCLLVEGCYVKDLSVLGRDLSRTVICDNTPHCWAFHPSNALPLPSWYDAPRDTALPNLVTPRLRQLLSAHRRAGDTFDVRVPLEQAYGLRRRLEAAAAARAAEARADARAIPATEAPPAVSAPAPAATAQSLQPVQGAQNGAARARPAARLIAAAVRAAQQAPLEQPQEQRENVAPPAPPAQRASAAHPLSPRWDEWLAEADDAAPQEAPPPSALPAPPSAPSAPAFSAGLKLRLRNAASCAHSRLLSASAASAALLSALSRPRPRPAPPPHRPAPPPLAPAPAPAPPLRRRAPPAPSSDAWTTDDGASWRRRRLSDTQDVPNRLSPLSLPPPAAAAASQRAVPKRVKRGAGAGAAVVIGELGADGRRRGSPGVGWSTMDGGRTWRRVATERERRLGGAAWAMLLAVCTWLVVLYAWRARFT
jgi:CTD small phosphatase-like protein 2